MRNWLIAVISLITAIVVVPSMFVFTALALVVVPTVVVWFGVRWAIKTHNTCERVISNRPVFTLIDRIRVAHRKAMPTLGGWNYVDPY